MSSKTRRRRPAPASLRITADDAPLVAAAVARYGTRSAAIRAAIHALPRVEDADARVAAERAAIVACLRQGTPEDTDAERALLVAFADMIERGEHVEGAR